MLDVVPRHPEALRGSTPKLEPLRPSAPAFAEAPVVLGIEKLAVHYGDKLAVQNVSLAVHAKQVTAFIGPSGCGKTTVLRSLNRMHDLSPGARVTGHVR